MPGSFSLRLVHSGVCTRYPGAGLGDELAKGPVVQYRNLDRHQCTPVAVPSGATVTLSCCAVPVDTSV